MTFERVKPLDWVVGELLTSEQQNQLDVDHAKAIDGVGGGAYTPTADLSVQSPTTKKVVLNGCTFLSTADGGGVVQCASSLSAVGQVGCGTLNVGSTAIIGSNLDVEGNLDVVGTATIAALQATTLTVNDNSTLGSSNADILTVKAVATFETLVNLQGQVGLSGTMGGTGTGRVIPKVLKVLSDGDFSIGAADYETVLVPDLLLTGNLNITIAHNVTANEAIEFEVLDQTYNVVIKHPTTLATLATMRNASGAPNWIRVRHVGSGTYKVTAKYVVP